MYSVFLQLSRAVQTAAREHIYSADNDAERYVTMKDLELMKTQLKTEQEHEITEIQMDIELLRTEHEHESAS